MTSTIDCPPVEQSGFAIASRPDGGAKTDVSCFEAARKPSGSAQVMPVSGALATPVAVVSASGIGQTAQSATPVPARRARLLRDLSLVSPAGVLVFVVGLALIGICTAIF